MKAILQWVLRTMMKDKTGVVQTLPNKDLVDFNVAMTAERLMRNGIDPNSLKNANQVENAINQIEAPRNVQQGIKSTKSAKIIDMEGKEIDPRSKIMGGKQAETEEEILERLNKENKEGIARIKSRQKMIDEAIDNVSPGFVQGDNKYNAELVAEEIATRRGLDYYDMDTKQRADIYGEAFDALMKMRDDLAQGGRAGFKLGSIDKARRAFLKTVGAAGAGITALKTGLLGLGKEAAPIVDKAVETVTEAPSYFFDLVAKIKLFGKQRQTPSYKERVNEFTYTGKNGDQYELIEDLDTGEIMIQKDKMGVGVSGDESFDVISDRTEMRYKKPKPDEGDPNPSEEYEEYKVEFDQDGTAADASQIDEISKKEIIEEVTEDAPSIKKASGGIAGMLGE